MSEAMIIPDSKEGWLKLFIPYDVDFIEDLKESLPSNCRWWDRNQKCWHVQADFLQTVLELCQEYCDATNNQVKPASKAAPQPNIFEEVFKIIPQDYTSRVYAALAQAVHPDHGGSNEIMKQLNLAFQNRARGGIGHGR